MRINRLTNVALQIRSNVLKLNNLRSIKVIQESLWYESLRGTQSTWLTTPLQKYNRSFSHDVIPFAVGHIGAPLSIA